MNDSRCEHPERLGPPQFFWLVIYAMCTLYFVTPGCSLSQGTGVPTQSASFKRQKDTEDSARLGVVQRQDMSVKATASGRVVSGRSTTIKAPYAGFVQAVFVKVGDKVKRGAPLLAVSEGVDERALHPFPMRAPFGGLIVEAPAQAGQQVEANKGASGKEYLLRIEDCSSFAVEAEFPEIDATRVRVGMPVTIRITALPKKTYTGVLEQLNLAASLETTWRSSRVVFPGLIKMNDFDEDIRPGLSALVDVEIAQRKGALVLGHEYIGSRADRFFVTRENGTEVPVKLGLQNESGAEVVEGVAEGDRIRLVDYMSLSRESRNP